MRHPVLEEIDTRVAELAQAEGIGMGDVMSLTQAQALMERCDVESIFQDDSEFDALMDANPELLKAYFTIDLIARHGKGDVPLRTNDDAATLH